MFKKYLIEPNSLFHKSLILSLCEPGEYVFHIEGLDTDLYKKLFNHEKIKFNKSGLECKSLPSKCEVIYLEEDTYEIKALVISSNNKYYLFKRDPQKNNQLNIHQKYISDNLASLLLDFEKHSKTKGKINYSGLGDFSIIKDKDYFEFLYEHKIKTQINKESTVYRLIFNENNNFTVDFVYLVKNKLVSIINESDLDQKVLNLETMNKHHEERNDCLFIDSEKKKINYFIFTYKSKLVNHYFLFKSLSDDCFEYIIEDISFNKLLAADELSNIKYKKCSSHASREFAKKRYLNFSSEYIEFEEEEELDFEAIKELALEESPLEITPKEKEELLKYSKELHKRFNLTNDISLTIHGRSRVLERLGEMSEDEMLVLAKVAYEFGKNPVHYYEQDPLMFKFLRYQQSKHSNKTLRIFKDVLFFFSFTPPHVLVTCFHYKANFDEFVIKQKN